MMPSKVRFEENEKLKTSLFIIQQVGINNVHNNIYPMYVLCRYRQYSVFIGNYLGIWYNLHNIQCIQLTGRILVEILNMSDGKCLDSSGAHSKKKPMFPRIIIEVTRISQ